MMNIYGAEHHLLVLSDTIDADFHQHTFVQVTVALRSAFEHYGSRTDGGIRQPFPFCRCKQAVVGDGGQGYQER